MRDDEALQRHVTALALRILNGYSFALAGSGALREHGIIRRLTHDADLFTADQDPEAFDEAVDRLASELSRVGFEVEQRGEPVQLELGPVLSLGDAVGSKVNALYSRLEARDFIDVDAIRLSEAFTDGELLKTAVERDAGFEVRMFRAQLVQLERITDDRFEEYGVGGEHLEALRGRFAEWARELEGG